MNGGRGLNEEASQMSFLARFRVLTKILAVIVLLSAITTGIAWLGVNALGSLNAGADDMNAASKRALLAMRANQNVLALSRAEFDAALDPRPENRAQARKVVDEQMKNFEARVDEVAKTRDEQARNMMPAVRDAWAVYRKQLDNTFQLADGAKDVKLDEQTERLRDSATKSRAEAAKLQASMRAVADRLSDRVENFAKAAADEYATTSRWMTIAAAAGIVLGLCLGFMIGQFGIAKPIRALVGLLQRMAKGETIEITGTERKDEIGETARAVNAIKDMLAEKAHREADAKAAQDRAAAERRRADMNRLADDFERAVGEIVQTVSSASTELEASATTLTSTADTTQKLSTTVAAASEEASTNVQSVASATEELTSSVGEIGRQVQESSRISTEAVDQAKKTDDRITKLAQAASRIGDVTKLITQIAEQTNLLALNATIEAARAGEAGKGFAVVAQEVKQLASQTGKATNEISTQIAEMQSATQDSVAAIKEISGTIGRISEIATAIASAVEQQGAATQEITRNVQQAAAGTTQVASNITDVSRGAAETGSASSQVLSSAQSLANESNRLKLEMSKFLVTVRAA
jgi:methyl-accepting chemotaxis protein